MATEITVKEVNDLVRMYYGAKSYDFAFTDYLQKGQYKVVNATGNPEDIDEQVIKRVKVKVYTYSLRSFLNDMVRKDILLKAVYKVIA